ncbi:MAG TPA: MarR family transcriptional regulator [Zeimonas sp.]
MSSDAARRLAAGIDGDEDDRRGPARSRSPRELRTAAVPHGQGALGALVGYNCRRAYLAVLEHSIRHMSEHDLRPTSFSVLSLVHHEPGLNSRQVSRVLGIHPPNLVAIIASLEARKLIERRPDPADARSLGLHPTVDGSRLASRLERVLARAEIAATSMLSDAERETLLELLRRIWSSPQQS